MNLQQKCTHNWEDLAALLPKDRTEMAVTTKAFVRPREIKNPDVLLRLLLLYSWGDLSLRETAAAASESEVAFLSDVALLKRFGQAASWIQALLTRLLQERTPPPVLPSLPYRIQIVDGSALSVPGSSKIDYRLHAQYNLLSQQFEALTLTTAAKGETLKNYTVALEDLFIADRGYGNRGGIAHICQNGGQALVRFSWSNLPLQTRDGEPFNLITALLSLTDGQQGDWEVQTISTETTPSIWGRVVAVKKDAVSTAKAIRVAKREARNKHRAIKPETLTACGYLFLFTTLSAQEANSSLLLSLYRFRWQVEMAFKLLKSCLHLDNIRAHSPPLVRSYLLAKLLGVVLLEDLTRCWVSFAPEDNDGSCPLSKWRLWSALWRTLIASLDLLVSLSDWLTHNRYYLGKYRDTSRRRQKQTLDQLLDCKMPLQND